MTPPDSQVHELFESQARRTPEVPAVVSGGRAVSYRELDALATGVAGRLTAAGVLPGQPVGILLDRDERLVAALLGIWKAGGAYVPLDPTFPAQRLRLLATDTKMPVVLSSRRLTDRAAQTGAPVLQDGEAVDDGEGPDGAGRDDGRLSAGVPAPMAAASDPRAYIMYTSGSTGTPKGVEVTHRNVVNLLQWAVDAFTREELSGVLAATSVCFDVSVVELFAPLVAGGTVIMAEDLLALPDLPARDRVQLVCGVPSALAALTRFPLPTGIRTVAPAGEALPRALADQLYALPGLERVVNCFGPTECTVYCAAYEVPRRDGTEPAIGGPVAGAVLSARDPETCQPVDEGELWVSGPVVARGYLNRPELTDERFVTTSDGQRWYRTGDLVRRDADDLYRYLGRLDDQVKIRGHRAELGEVQAALAAHPEVHHAVVLAPPDGHGTRRLVGYVEPVSTPPDEPRLRHWLRDRLPGYLLPSRIVALDRMPLGPTGKVDRAALPVPETARPGGAAYVAPRDPVEAGVAAVMADVLALPEVGVEDQFGDLGGHSLAAAQVVARLAGEWEEAVPLGWFLAAPTAAALARRVTEARAGAPARLAVPAGPVRHPGETVAPLSDLQREFWLTRRLYPKSSTTVAFRLLLSGVTATDRVRAALDGVVARHEVLRTTFEEGVEGPVAVVHPPAPVPVTEPDRCYPADRVAADRVAADVAATVFDPGTDVPLLRAGLVHTGPEAADLVVAIDHAAFDGYSIGILMSELATTLAGDTVAEPELQVGDVARYERTLATDTGATDALRAHWRERLRDLSPPRELAGRRAERRTADGARTTRRLDRDLVDALDAVARDCRVSRFAVFTAALGVLLHRLTGESAAVIGTVAALRDRPGLARVVGPLVRVLPVPLRMTGDASGRDLATRAMAAATDALAHQDLTGADLAASAGFEQPPGAPLCPVILTMQPDDMPVEWEVGPARVALAGEVATGMAVTDLALFVNRVADPGGGDAFEVQAEYDTGRYRDPEVDTLLDLWLRLLRGIAGDPDRALSGMELLDPDQRRSLLRQGTGPALPAHRPATVVDAITARLAETPGAVAVVGRDGELTYAELLAISHQLAAALTSAGTGRGDPVGVCVPRDRMLPAALLGVVRAGAAYVPLDPEHPADRLAWLADDCGVRLVVSRGDALPAASGIPGVAVVDIDRLPVASLAASAPPPELPEPPAPDDVAYVLYTSGSTGRPKGVEVRHSNLADHTTALAHVPGLDSEDAVLALAPLTFDAVGIEIWSPLAAGARCLVVERDRVLDAHALVERLSATPATVAFLPPTVLRMLRTAGWAGDRRLRVWCGGEAVDAALVHEMLPLVKALWNVYGPTETTTLSVVHRLTGDAETPPIGRPLPGEWAYVADASGRLLPPGTVGELWIGGSGVAGGYRGRPELTGAAFVPDPYVPGGRCYRTGDLVRWDADGLLEFVGRADHQVKIRGQRVELGEIEAVLHEHPGVRQAVVTVDASGTDASLVGYLAPRTVDPAGVADFCRHRLPGHMVPGRWTLLDTVPTTPNGKVDRQGLPPPAPSPASPVDEPPRTDMEAFLAEIWGEILGVTDVGRHGDFLALGGNSLAATRVVARVRAVLGCDVPVGSLFDTPVLAGLAAEVERLALAHLAGTEDLA